MEISRTDVLQRRDILLLDIRDLREREAVGYIPGSLPLPLDPRDEFLLGLAHLPREPLALVCMSGRRSNLSIPLAVRQGFPEIYSLTGGVLGWGADGLPLCGLQEPPAPPQIHTIDAIERELISCFVAETIETVLSQDGDLSVDPHREVLNIIAAARQRTASPARALREAVTSLGRIAWRRGHPPAKIAENIDLMMAMIAAYEQSAATI